MLSENNLANNFYVDAHGSINVDHIARTNYAIVKLTNLETFTLKNISFSSPQTDSFILIHDEKKNSKTDLDPGQSLFAIAFVSNIEKFRPRSMRLLITFYESNDQSSNFYIYDDNFALATLGTANQMINDLDYYLVPSVSIGKLQTKLSQTAIDGVFASDSMDLLIIADMRTSNKEFRVYGNVEKLTGINSDVKIAYLAGRTLSIIDDLFMIDSDSNNIEILRFINKLNNYLTKLKVPIRIKNIDFESDSLNNSKIRRDLLEIDKYMDDYETKNNKKENENLEGK